MKKTISTRYIPNQRTQLYSCIRIFKSSYPQRKIELLVKRSFRRFSEERCRIRLVKRARISNPTKATTSRTSTQSLKHSPPRHVEQEYDHLHTTCPKSPRTQHTSRTPQPWLPRATTKTLCQRALRGSKWARRRLWLSTISLVCGILYHHLYGTSLHVVALSFLFIHDLSFCTGGISKERQRGVILHVMNDPSSSCVSPYCGRLGKTSVSKSCLGGGEQRVMLYGSSSYVSTMKLHESTWIACQKAVEAQAQAQAPKHDSYFDVLVSLSPHNILLI